MYPPTLPGRRQRTAEEGIDQERRLQELNRDYEGSPWLTALVVFSGFLVALVGTFDTLFLLGTALTGRTWWPYAVILAALVGTHACLRAVRYGRRRQAIGTWDRRRVPRKRTEHARNA
jgi:small-conductance mechanosensitive channel